MPHVEEPTISKINTGNSFKWLCHDSEFAVEVQYERHTGESVIYARRICMASCGVGQCSVKEQRETDNTENIRFKKTPTLSLLSHRTWRSGRFPVTDSRTVHGEELK
jgi:hypothetical protein